MVPSGETPPRSDAAARLRHQAFFETLQQGEGTRDWLAARAGLLVLRHVLARSDAEWEIGSLAAEEKSVAIALEALAPDDPERLRLSAVLAGFHSTRLRPDELPDARAPHALEPVADALIAYGDVLLERSAWALAADVYATVWDTRAAPDTRFGGGIDPRAVEDKAARPATTDAVDGEGEEGLQIAPASAMAALKLAICYRMLGRSEEAVDAYAAARAAATQCRDPDVGEYVRYRAWLGDALMVLEGGDMAAAEQQLADLGMEISSNPRLRDLLARVRHAQAVAAYRRHKVSR
jgi:tetratricopeptide (TPR) repeat protein